MLTGSDPKTQSLGPLSITPSSTNINLVMTSFREIIESEEISLFMQGATAGSNFEFRKLNLFMSGEYRHVTFNLFLKGPTSQLVAGNNTLNLSLVGSGTYSSGFVPLFVGGSSAQYAPSLNTLTLEQLYELTLDQLYELPLDSAPIFTGYYKSQDLTLYIMGEGLIDGASVGNSFLNLFLQGGKGSFNDLKLFLQGIPPSQQYVPLHMNGILGFLTKNLDLYLFNKQDFLHQLNLFIRGFQ